MFFEFRDIILKVDLKKHYKNETEESKILHISISIQVDKRLLEAKKLEDTFDYADYEIKFLGIFEGRSFELIEEVASLIFEFTENYSKDILSCKISILKKNVLINAKEISMNVYREFNRLN